MNWLTSCEVYSIVWPPCRDGLTGTDLHGPGCDRDRQQKMIEAEEMLKAEDIAAAIHFALTRPRRAVVQSISVVPRNSQE